VYNKDQPVIIQASAAIHSGNSGGVLVSSSGNWLGLVTCNIKRRLHTAPQDEDSSIITRLNFSIASSLISPAILSYVNSGGNICLW
jgi:S1-C subfamily serine protease